MKRTQLVTCHPLGCQHPAHAFSWPSHLKCESRGNHLTRSIWKTYSMHYLPKKKRTKETHLISISSLAEQTEWYHCTSPKPSWWQQREKHSCYAGKEYRTQNRELLCMVWSEPYTETMHRQAWKKVGQIVCFKWAFLENQQLRTWKSWRRGVPRKARQWEGTEPPLSAYLPWALFPHPSSCGSQNIWLCWSSALGFTSYFSFLLSLSLFYYFVNSLS